jgi:hypothetical protein
MDNAMETVKISKESYAWRQLEANPIGTAAELAELKAALTQSRAETAAAYERAADSLLECSVWCDSQDRATPEWRNGAQDARKHHMARIRAISTPDQTAALDAVRADARAQGMREAAIIAHDKSYMDAHDAIIIAAINGAKA